jgi:hypothetical protein
MGNLIYKGKKIKIEAPIDIEFPSGLFKGVGVDTVAEIFDKDIIPLIEEGYRYCEKKEIPSKIDAHAIKEDILDGESWHSGKTCHWFFKNNWDVWGKRYSVKEIEWMMEFVNVARELDCKLPDSWFNMFAIVRGYLDSTFPHNISFALALEKLLELKQKEENNAS